MNEIMVKGTQEFMGFTIPIVYGGFGERQKCVAANTVAEIHGVELFNLNTNIRRLIDRNRMNSGVDYINLLNCQQQYRDIAKELGFLKSNRTKDAFLLSERGYMKLIKYMDDDTSWDVMENFIDEYFRMKEHIETSTSPTLTQDDFQSIISYMEEQEQKENVQIK